MGNAIVCLFCPPLPITDPRSEEYQYWLSKIKEDCIELKDAPDELRNDKTIVLTSVRQHGFVLQYASPIIRNSKDVVMESIQNGNGWVLKYASPELQNDKVVVVAAIHQSQGIALRHASQQVQNDKDVVLGAVKLNGRALKFASPELQNNEEVVLAAIQNEMEAFQYASFQVRNNKEILMSFLQEKGRWRLLQYASPELQNDRDIVLVAVRQDGYALQFASPRLQNDKTIVLAAIKSNVDSIKYVHHDLQQFDSDILIAAGMFDKRHVHDDKGDDDDGYDATKKRSMTSTTTAIITTAGPSMMTLGRIFSPWSWFKQTTTKTSNSTNNIRINKTIALSTRFSLDPKSMSQATNFTKLLTEHEYIRTGNFKVFAPNAYEKQTCDPNWTDFNHSCRGTKDTCQYKNVLTSTTNGTGGRHGRPTNDCCWRYSFRFQLEEAKENGGFILQLVETGEAYSKKVPTLGDGQKIERDMAQQLQMKIFQVYKPRSGEYEAYFAKRHIKEVVTAIKSWYDDGCVDMSECIVRPSL